MQNCRLPGFLKRYKQAFIPSHYPPFSIQSPTQQEQRSWLTETRPGIYLTDQKIEAHLQGRYWIGPVPETFTRSLIIDLDEDRRSLDRRTEQVRAAFPGADPLIFSTPRGGRHLHFMLDGPAWSDRTAAFAKDRLTDAGVELAPGRVEVFPAGRKAIRAPLGRDCHLLDPHTLDPVDRDRAGCLWTLDELLETERYDRLAIPEDYRATQTPQTPQKATRRRTGRSGSEYMLEVDRLLREGLWQASQRNDAFLKLTWFIRVIWGFNEQQTVAELRAWIDQFHNGHSREFNQDPQRVYRKVEDVARCFDPDKVGTKSTYKAAEASRKAGSDLERAIEGFLDAAPLDGRERAFLGRLLRYAHQRGADTLDGGEIEVQIPARTLKTWNWQYGPILRALMIQGYVEKTGNHGANIGRCTSYRVLCLD